MWLRSLSLLSDIAPELLAESGLSHVDMASAPNRSATSAGLRALVRKAIASSSNRLHRQNLDIIATRPANSGLRYFKVYRCF